MKVHKNDLIVKKWIKILVSIYKGIDKSSFSTLFTDVNKKITEKEADIILNNQLNLLQKRKPNLKGLTIEKLKAFSLE